MPRKTARSGYSTAEGDTPGALTATPHRSLRERGESANTHTKSGFTWKIAAEAMNMWLAREP
jgi:hypothetical protein